MRNESKKYSDVSGHNSEVSTEAQEYIDLMKSLKTEVKAAFEQVIISTAVSNPDTLRLFLGLLNTLKNFDSKAQISAISMYANTIRKTNTLGGTKDEVIKLIVDRVRNVTDEILYPPKNQ